MYMTSEFARMCYIIERIDFRLERIDMSRHHPVKGLTSTPLSSGHFDEEGCVRAHC